MPEWGAYYFGVEIESIAKPLTVQHPLERRIYYEKLAAELRSQGAKADADTLKGRYGKHPEHYDKWWITKDGSLGDPEHPLIPLEAVSPILSSTLAWESTISTFWRSFNRVFHMPTSSSRCGSHIHVSPWPSRKFSLAQLHALAFGVIHYEFHVQNLLPEYRQHNKYCRSNTEHSAALRRLLRPATRSGRVASHSDVWKKVRGFGDARQLRDFMQVGGDDPKKDRYVLWNFDNVARPGGSGTVEFRGGRGFRGPVRTKRWIAFVLAFVHFCLHQKFGTWSQGDFADPTMSDFWEGILEAAQVIGVKKHLPSRWKVMCEQISDNSPEEVTDDSDDSSSDSDDSSILGKSDSEYSDSGSSDSGPSVRDLAEEMSNFIVGELGRLHIALRRAMR